jgi:hypothetical protein
MFIKEKKMKKIILTSLVMLLFMFVGCAQESTSDDSSSEIKHGTVTLSNGDCFNLIQGVTQNWNAEVGQITYFRFDSSVPYEVEFPGDTFIDITMTPNIIPATITNNTDNRITSLDSKIGNRYAIMFDESFSNTGPFYFAAFEIENYVSGSLTIEYWGKSTPGGDFSID